MKFDAEVEKRHKLAARVAAAAALEKQVADYRLRAAAADENALREAVCVRAALEELAQLEAEGERRRGCAAEKLRLCEWRLQQASRKIQAGQAFMNEGKAARCGWILRRTDADKLGRKLTRADFALGSVLGTGVSGVVLLGRLRSAGGDGSMLVLLRLRRAARCRGQLQLMRAAAAAPRVALLSTAAL